MGNTLTRIAVIEDDADLNRLLCRRLSRADYEVHSAADGVVGLALMKEFPPAIAVIDWMMPKMSGIELIQRVRQDPELSGIKILMLTARSQEGDRIRARNSGADDYLVKPFAATNLLASLQALEQQI